MGLKQWFMRSTGAGAGTAAPDAACAPALQRCATVFPLGGVDHAWGITPQALCRCLQLAPAATQDARWQSLPGGHYFGLDIAEVQIGRVSGWPDRPVSQVWYAVRSDPAQRHLRQAKAIHERVVREFGTPPSGSARFEVSKESYPGTIAAWAEWRTGGVRWRYSTYGAPRRQGGVNTVGFIALDWDDEVAMAVPLLPEWHARNAALAVIDDAQRIAGVAINCAATHAHRRYHFDAATAPDADPQQVMATRVLYYPDRLVTPPTIAALHDGSGLWLWRSASRRCWGVSSASDTVVFNAGDAARCVWHHSAPARGPGADQIDIASLTATRAWAPLDQCNDLAEFAARLQRLPGVSYQFIDSIDD